MSQVLVSASTSAGQNEAVGQLELSYSDNGSNWGACPIAPLSSAPVAVAAFNNLLWVAYRGQTRVC